MKLKNGDLVMVSNLPSYMYHFDVSVGVICEMTKRGEFFIQKVNSKGKLIMKSKFGWYSPANVTLIESGYVRGHLDGKTVYKDIPNLNLSIYMEKAKALSKHYSKLRLERWNKILNH